MLLRLIQLRHTYVYHRAYVFCPLEAAKLGVMSLIQIWSLPHRSPYQVQEHPLRHVKPGDLDAAQVLHGQRVPERRQEGVRERLQGGAHRGLVGNRRCGELGWRGMGRKVFEQSSWKIDPQLIKTKIVAPHLTLLFVECFGFCAATGLALRDTSIRLCGII